LLKARRPYRREWEWSLFDIQRVYSYLATFAWHRKANNVGQVMVGGIKYSVGRAYATQTFAVGCDAHTGQWCFRNAQGVEIARRAIQHLDAQYLPGLTPIEPSPGDIPIQLTLPYLL
jgi:hypothetical protein